MSFIPRSMLYIVIYESLYDLFDVVGHMMFP